MKIVWSPLARARLREIRAYIAMDKPDAAKRLVTRLVATVDALRHHPHLGRPGIEPGIRELIVGGTPYIILYRIREDQIILSTIWHAAQQRPKSPQKPD